MIHRIHESRQNPTELASAGPAGVPTVRFRYAGREFRIAGADPRDHIYRVIRNSRAFYELELLEYVRFVARLERPQGQICIDVGANIGNHSIYFAAILGTKVISVEPNSKVLPILRENLRQNLEHSYVCESAVGAEKGTGRVVLPSGGSNNLGMARVGVTQEPGDGGVAIVTLDSVLADFRAETSSRARVFLMKIDVEGAELAVLEGAKGILSSERPHVLVEAQTDADRQAFSNYLGQRGYELVTTWGWHATPMLHFAPNPKRWVRMAARAYQYGAMPEYVARAVLRKLRGYAAAHLD